MRPLIVLGLLLSFFTNSHGQVKEFYELETAKKAALAENNILLVDVYTDWCYWCKQLDKITFADEQVSTILKQNFVIVHLNAEDNAEGSEFAKRYAISGYPTLAYFRPDGAVLNISAGFMEPAPYLIALDNIQKAFKDGKVYTGYTSKPLKFPEFYSQLFHYEKKQKRTWPSDSILDLYFDTADLNSEISFLIMNRLGCGKRNQNRCLLQINNFRQRFPEDEVNQLFTGILGHFVKNNSNEGPETLGKINRMIEQYGPSDSAFRKQLELSYTIEYFKTRSEWRELAQMYSQYLLKNPEDKGSESNGLAWDIYENSKDTVALNLAMKWMQDYTQKTEEYASEDTYASLLFACGKLQEAEKSAIHAITLGNAAGVNTESTQKLLETIRSQR